MCIEGGGVDGGERGCDLWRQIGDMNPTVIEEIAKYRE